MAVNFQSLMNTKSVAKYNNSYFDPNILSSDSLASHSREVAVESLSVPSLGVERFPVAGSAIDLGKIHYLYVVNRPVGLALHFDEQFYIKLPVPEDYDLERQRVVVSGMVLSLWTSLGITLSSLLS